MLALVLAPIVVLTAPTAQVCKLPPATSTANHAPAHAQKLGELPDAEMDLAVLRTIDGCSVRQVVRTQVSDRSHLDWSPKGFEIPGYTGRMVVEGPAAARPAEPVR